MVQFVRVPTSRRTTRNLYKVPAKQWNRWSPHAREVFNEVYKGLEVQEVITHPKQGSIPGEHWRTVRWNAAWLAADAASTRAKPRIRVKHLIPGVLTERAIIRALAEAWALGYDARMSQEVAPAPRRIKRLN